MNNPYQVTEITVSYKPAFSRMPVILKSQEAYIELKDFFPDELIQLKEQLVVMLENPETLTIKIRLSLTTKWIDNQKFSWSIKTGNAWSQRPDFPL